MYKLRIMTFYDADAAGVEQGQMLRDLNPKTLGLREFTGETPAECYREAFFEGFSAQDTVSHCWEEPDEQNQG